ncbi:cache domain-containing protein [Alkaliphilus transvaalensis]|uniref:cache domain-containing protein n=1 Tax=Alkaliphilus transvaalensis TaxID=114628 RepID=UPI00047E819B|nr:cache domain-containing protein [Alkaliphilus transvaalensis]
MKKYKSLLIIYVLLLGVMTLSGCSDDFTSGLKYMGIDASSSEYDFGEYQEIIANFEDYYTTIDLLVHELLEINIEDPSEILNILENLYSKNDQLIISVYFAKESGEFNLYPYLQLPDGYDPRTRNWYYEAVEDGVHLSDIYVDITSESYSATISRPVLKNGKVIGVAGIDFKLK